MEQLVAIRKCIFVREAWLQKASRVQETESFRILADAAWNPAQSGIQVLGTPSETRQVTANLSALESILCGLRTAHGQHNGCLDVRVGLLPGREADADGQFEIQISGKTFLAGVGFPVADIVVKAIIQGAEMAGRIRAKSETGELVASVCDTSDFRGIHCSFVHASTGTEIDVCSAAFCENGDLAVYRWPDPYSEDYEDSPMILPMRDIHQALGYPADETCAV